MLEKKNVIGSWKNPTLFWIYSEKNTFQEYAINIFQEPKNNLLESKLFPLRIPLSETCSVVRLNISQQ